jgi:tRNA-2-methylthio-N6-dimethylallyladenosine synthase
MPRYYIWTIGCQMNQAESERLSSLLEQSGYQAVTRPDEADLVLLNSCVVRQSAENRILNKIHSLKSLKISHPELTIAVTGCLVGDNGEQLKKKFPQVDQYFRPGDLPDWLGNGVGNRALPLKPKVGAFVPVIYGCNNFCSYCIVPYRRGRERSRPIEEIITEVRELIRHGIKEVTLLGQNVDSYGRDLTEQPDLADLLTKVNSIEGLNRIRFLTNHPKDMSLKLIQSIARLPKVCEQLNLPAQSGSDAILAAMKRGYNTARYRELIANIRSYVPSVAISTDIIVGFPGETELDFQETLKLLSEVKFDNVHVAAYSPRPGTSAARELENDVPPGEKKRRFNVIEELEKGIAGEINARLRDKTVPVLVKARKNGLWWGRTRTDKLVFFASPHDYQGRLVPVRITSTGPWSLKGTVVLNSNKERRQKNCQKVEF